MFKSDPFLAMSSLLSADHRWYSSTVLPWKLMTNFIWWHNCWQCHVTNKNEILPPRQRRNQTTNPIRIEWKNNLMKSTSWFWFIWTRSIFGSFFLLKMAIFDQKWPVKVADVVENWPQWCKRAEIRPKMAENWARKWPETQTSLFSLSKWSQDLFARFNPFGLCFSFILFDRFSMHA